jgi:hypothetical protein
MPQAVTTVTRNCRRQSRNCPLAVMKAARRQPAELGCGVDTLCELSFGKVLRERALQNA